MTANRTTTLVYAGRGSSHSWTWLADLFESRGCLDARFLGAEEFTENLRDDVRSIIISGGDGHRIASTLGAHGFAHMKGFIHKGGTYVGICAGAYLPLPSSIEPFDKFNISSTKIENIDRGNPGAVSPRLGVKYGSCSIVHPVRGEVELGGIEALRAPIYGGPVFKESTRDEVLLKYLRFTESTEFQSERMRAASTMLGKPAAIRARHGLGELILLGPHLEHPRYPRANNLFLRLPKDGFAVPMPEHRGKTSSSNEDQGLMHSIADLKVAILGLENRAFLVGNKLWDGSRFLELLAAIEKRAHTTQGSVASRIVDLLTQARNEIISARDESFEYVDEGPQLLVEAARICVDNHFLFLRENR